ncbi:MAG TPA: murein biosynthesis integral membrane protein MurJ [Jatrophihabitans sp.]|nr:murein biosynthesis integral membrane protein MurJ [Jatrophihabitans sp.]
MRDGTDGGGSGWSGATHYAGGQQIEPRTFTEADPISAAPLLAEAAADAEVWGATTYLGRPRRHRAKHAAPEDDQTDAAPTAEPAARPDEGERSLLANSRTMAIATFASRLTGFLRNVLLVAALGATSQVSIAYNSGNNLPNMIYELLLGGVLSSVLIPLLVKAEAEDADRGLAYTQRLFSIATAALAAMTIVVVAAAPWIAAAFVPAGPQRHLTSIFATLLLPEIFFYGLGAMFIAVLNIKHVYGPGAWSPLANNLVMIATIVVFWQLPGPTTLDPRTMTNAQILVLGIGTTLGIAAQALVLVPALRRTGFRWAWRFRARPGENDRLRELGALTVWVLGYVAVSQVGVSVIQKVGISNGGFTVFTNADLLFQMPYGILVVSLLTAIMPRMSRAAVRNDNAEVVADLSLGARLSAVALLPITALLLVLGPVLGITLFTFHNATIDGARLIGSALAWSAFGLFPFALVMLQLRVFYAMRDGRTPTLINVFMVATKIALVLIANEAFQAPAGTDINVHPSTAAVEWLNTSTSLSYVVGAVAGHVLLSRRLGRLGFRRVLRTFAEIAVVSTLAALAAWGVVVWTGDAFGTGRAGSFAGLALGGLVGFAVLAVIGWRAPLPETRAALSAARR